MANQLKPAETGERQLSRAEEEYIRTELNFERWQIFATSKFQGNSRVLTRDGAEVIIGRVEDERSKKGYRETGVFRTFDMKIYYALVKFWEKAGRPVDKNVIFSVHEIADSIDFVWGGTTHRRITNSLKKLSKIPIDWRHSYYDKAEDVYEQLVTNFNILTELSLYEREERGQLTLAISAFRFHHRIIENLQLRYSKPLHLAILLGFQKEIAMLLYRHVDLVMADKSHYAVTTEKLINDGLQLEGERYRYPSRRKQVLEPALKELRDVPLSTGVLREVKLVRTKSSRDWKVLFKKERFKASLPRGGKFKRPIPLFKDEGEVDYIVEELIKHLDDPGSQGFFYKVARLMPTDLIYRRMKEAKADYRPEEVRVSLGAIFTDKIKRDAKALGIDLGLKAADD